MRMWRGRSAIAGPWNRGKTVGAAERFDPVLQTDQCAGVPPERSTGHDGAATASVMSVNVARATPVNPPAVAVPPEPCANPS
jgi:hypothetical protein